MERCTRLSSAAIMGILVPGASFSCVGWRVASVARAECLGFFLSKRGPNADADQPPEEEEAEGQVGEGRYPASLSGAKPSWYSLGGGRDSDGEQQENGGGGDEEEEEEEGQMEEGAGSSFAQQLRELRSRNCEVKLDGGNGTRRTGLLCPSRMTVRAEQRPDGSLGSVRLEYTVTHWNHPVGVLSAMNASVWWTCQYLFCFSSAARLLFVVTRDEKHQVQPQVRQWLVQQVHDGVSNKRILEKVRPVLVVFLVLVRFSFFLLLLLDLPVCAAPRGRSLPRRGH